MIGSVERFTGITYVIPCGGQKLPHAAPAKDIYTGSMFRHTYENVARLVADDLAAGRGGGQVRILILAAPVQRSRNSHARVGIHQKAVYGVRAVDTDAHVCYCVYMTNIEATITVKIQKSFGPDIDDPKHVAAWLVADGYEFEGEYAGFRFAVCSACPDPDTCDHGEADSEYAAMVLSVDTAEVDD